MCLDVFLGSCLVYLFRLTYRIIASSIGVVVVSLAGAGGAVKKIKVGIRINLAFCEKVANIRLMISVHILMKFGNIELN